MYTVYILYTHTYVHLTLQRAKLTLQRAFFSKWCIEGSNRRGQGSGQAALCSQSSRAVWSRVVMDCIYGIWYCCWWSHELALLSGHDKLTTHLFKLQETASFLQLERTEQLGVLLVAVYLRNPPFPERNWHAFILIFAKWSMSKLWMQYLQNGFRFAKFLLDRAQSKKTALQFSLLDGILAFWRATKGPGNRRAYLPPRKVKQRKQKNAKAVLIENSFPQIVCRVSGVAGSELVKYFHCVIA